MIKYSQSHSEVNVPFVLVAVSHELPNGFCWEHSHVTRDAHYIRLNVGGLQDHGEVHSEVKGNIYITEIPQSLFYLEHWRQPLLTEHI